MFQIGKIGFIKAQRQQKEDGCGGSGKTKSSMTRALSEDGVRGKDKEKKMVQVQLGGTRQTNGCVQT